MKRRFPTLLLLDHETIHSTKEEQTETLDFESLPLWQPPSADTFTDSPETRTAVINFLTK